MINPRYMFRIAVFDKTGKFDRFVFFSAISGAPAITCREGCKFSKPEQCTGVLDRHGKMIFEGDILATSNDNPEFDLWGPEDFGYTKIVWNDYALCFGGSEWNFETEYNDPNADSVYNVQFVSVVGNIHETPELLEEKKKK